MASYYENTHLLPQNELELLTWYRFSLRFSTSDPSCSSSCCWFAQAPMYTISPRVSWTETRTGMQNTHRYYTAKKKKASCSKANNWPCRVMGIFWKCARIGERLSPYISICCVIMAVRTHSLSQAHVFSFSKSTRTGCWYEWYLLDFHPAQLNIYDIQTNQKKKYTNLNLVFGHILERERVLHTFRSFRRTDAARAEKGHLYD